MRHETGADVSTYFPLHELNAEIAEMISKLNNNYQLMKIDSTMLGVSSKKQEKSQWHEEMEVYTKECLEIMRGLLS